ncbi:tyrosine recombinase XerC [Ravibacter arvi]|uniref:Tyrosine recombinase XerC n=1 Tax=Ravibacter arvi TaxID=2051041 RepID=A0ABP8LYF9_9BACT
MRDLLKVFLDHLQYEKRSSRHTVAAYRSDLEQLGVYLLEQGKLPGQAERNDLRGWVVLLAGQKLSPVSINRKIAAMRAFYKFLKRKGFIENDPAGFLNSLKKPKKPPGFVEESAMELLFEEVNFEDSASGRRDRLVIEILYGTGMRLSELIGLKIEDVNIPAATLKVFGKRSKERIIPVTRSLITLIGNCITEREPVESDAPLIVTDKGEPLYPVFVQRLVKKYLSAVTSIEHKSPHLLRHTYATHLLNRGADLNAIKELLGHAGLAATQVYTHNAIEELKRTFLQAHPKA